MKPMLFLWTLFCFLMACPSGYAKEELDEFQTAPAESVMMDKVVVTATRSAESIYRVPSNVAVITSEDIKKSGATSIPDALERQANVRIRSYSGNPGDAQIDMRGFGGDNPFGKTLILLNGRKLNRPDMASINWLQVPIEQIEKIEVVRGANSVLYGDAAVGGVINIITKKGDQELKADASLIMGSHGAYIERVGIAGSQGGLFFAATGENNSRTGYRDHSAFNAQGAGLNLSWDFDDTLTLAWETSWNKTDSEMPGSLTKEQLAQNRRQYQSGVAAYFVSDSGEDETKNEYMDGRFSIEKNIGGVGDIELSAVYGSKEITSNMASWYLFSAKEMGTIGFLPKFMMETDISGMKNRLTVGLDMYWESMDEDQYQSKDQRIKTNALESKKESLGGYFRNELSLRDDLIFNFGGRIEKIKISGKETDVSNNAIRFDDETIHRANAIDIGLTRLFGKHAALFGKFSTSYRYPFLDEQMSWLKNPGTWQTTKVFNTDLEPETGKNYEIGGRFQGDRFNGSLSFFQIDMEDEISADPVTWEQKNLGETRHRGVELSFSYRPNDAAYFYGNYNYQKATFENGDHSGNDIPLVPHHQATLGFDLSLGHVYLSPSVRYVSEAYLGGDDKNSVEKLGGFGVYDLYLRYEGEENIPGGPKISGFIGVKNMFNKEYCGYGIYDNFVDATFYYPSAGREFFFGATLAF